MRVVGIDPGMTTGCVAVEKPWRVVDVAQVCSDTDLINWLNNMRPDKVVAESFRLYPWLAKSLSYSNMPAAEALGVIKLWCSKRGTPLTLYPASSLKTVSDTLLRACGLWAPTKGAQHARDAARHVLLWAIKNWPEEVTSLLVESKGEKANSSPE